MRLPNPPYENQATGADPPSGALRSPTRIRGMANGLDVLSGGAALGCLCSVHFQDLRRRVDEAVPPVNVNGCKADRRGTVS